MSTGIIGTKKIIEKDIEDQEIKHLKNEYVGKKVKMEEVNERTIRISYYEFLPSKFRPSKDCLYAQVQFIDDDGNLVNRPIITEAIELVHTIKTLKREEDNEHNYIYYGYVSKNKKGYYSFSTPTEDEKREIKEALKRMVTPTKGLNNKN